MKTPSRRGQVILGITSVILLTALSLVAVGILGSLLNPGGSGFLSRTRCVAPNLPGPVVGVSLTDMGGPMMRRPSGMMGGAMRMTADQSTVTHGPVSFLVTNAGSVNHELVVLPLPDNQIPGTRPIRGDARIEEAGSLGEASNTCADGARAGKQPRAAGGGTNTQPPGREELIKRVGMLDAASGNG